MYSREYGVRSESQSLFPGFGWLGRGFGSLISGGSPPKPPSPSRALDLRPLPPSVVPPARAPDASLGTSDPRPTAAASVLHQSSQVNHPPFQGELPPLATEGSLDVPAHSSSSVRPRVLDFGSVAASSASKGANVSPGHRARSNECSVDRHGPAPRGHSRYGTSPALRPKRSCGIRFWRSRVRGIPGT